VANSLAGFGGSNPESLVPRSDVVTPCIFFALKKKTKDLRNPERKQSSCEIENENKGVG
jgi:hypothetical protein